MMNDDHFNILAHSLGMKTGNYRRRLSWWLDDENHRNHYATADGCNGCSTVIELVELGLMKRGRLIPGGMIYFHVNAHGIQAVRQEFFERRKKAAEVGRRPGGPGVDGL